MPVTDLKIKVKGLVEAGALREALVFPHEVGQSEVAVGAFLLREENSVVEA